MGIMAGLAAEETSSGVGFPLWWTYVIAIVLLWVVAIGLVVWALRRSRRRRR
ncbi:hypothetical protein ACFY36_15885 [Actinoplanes sp. NPDC000266]